MSKLSPTRLRLLKAMPRAAQYNIRGEHDIPFGDTSGVTINGLWQEKYLGTIALVGDRPGEQWVLTDKGREALAKAEETIA